MIFRTATPTHNSRGPFAPQCTAQSQCHRRQALSTAGSALKRSSMPSRTRWLLRRPHTTALYWRTQSRGRNGRACPNSVALQVRHNNKHDTGSKAKQKTYHSQQQHVIDAHANRSRDHHRHKQRANGHPVQQPLIGSSANTQHNNNDAKHAQSQQERSKNRVHNKRRAVG